MANTVKQHKEKDFDSIVPRFTYCDMEEQTRKDIVDVCRDAYKRQHDGEFKYYKDLAFHIKKTLDAKYSGAWHVVVGTSFGSYVSYEHKCLSLFWLEHIGFLVFKHGWFERYH